MTATESLLPEIINDFFNKIGQKRTLAELLDHFVGGSARVQTKPHFT
jgi:hypothetical protein